MSRLIPLSRFLHYQSLHKLSPQKIRQNEYAIIRANPIRPARLIPSVPIDEFALTIDFHTTKDISRVWDASEIRYASLVSDVDPTSSTSAAVAALIGRAERAGVPSARGLEKGGASVGDHDGGFGLDDGIEGGIFADDGVEDGEELRVRGEGFGRGWELRGCADG